MQKFKLVLTLCLTLLSFLSFGQGMKKVHLSTSTKIISETEAELIVTAKMDKGWHLYSFNPGGDGSLIAPELKFDKSPWSAICRQREGARKAYH
jgi:DsbC/DsbD-like thiol-disulfide interchange protein